MTIVMNPESKSPRSRSRNSTRILAIDSDRYSRNFLSQSLGEFGTVKLIDPGPHVFEIAKKYKPGLVMLRLDEKDLNGLSLCRWLKETRPDVCIVLMTNPDCESDLVHEFSMIDGQVTSPVDPRQLKSLLCQLLEAQLRANSTRISQKRYENVQRHFASSVRHAASQENVAAGLSNLIMIAAMKDQGAGHLSRVMAYSQCIATQLRDNSAYSGEITDDFLIDLQAASQLHDIGNLIIGDELLGHSGTLSDSEFETIKMHTTLGADLLKQAFAKSPESRALKMAERIARAHHEFWDGNGYPNQLAATQIPLEARIVAVADVYDALTSNRSFRDCFTPELSRNVIVNESGMQFDPVVVKAFLDCFEQIESVSVAINSLASIESNAAETDNFSATSGYGDSGDAPGVADPDLSTRALEEYREKQQELVAKFRDAMELRIASLKSAYFEGERQKIAKIAGELHKTATMWELNDAKRCALDLQNVIKRSASVEQIGAKVQKLLVSINAT